MIGVFDYSESGSNLRSVASMLDSLRVDYIISRHANRLLSCDKFILPGVGSFDATMKSLTETGLSSFIHDYIVPHSKPLLGICVGMQVLCDSSEEGDRPGLGLITGSVKLIDINKIKSKLKLPHMGWNSVNVLQERHNCLFDSIDLKQGFYYLHNYRCVVAPEHLVAVSNYWEPVESVISHGSIYGAQFHPEKSHVNGIHFMRNFLSL